MAAPDKAILNRARRRDKIARWVVILGGMAVIASVIAILFLILGTAVPLFFPARSELLAGSGSAEPQPPADVLHVGVEESVDGRAAAAHVFRRDGTLAVIDLATGNAVLSQSLRGTDVSSASGAGPTERNAPHIAGEGDGGARSARPTLLSVDSAGGATYGLLWSDGEVSVAEVKTAGAAAAGGTPAWKVETVGSLRAPAGVVSVRAVVRRPDAERLSCALLTQDNRVIVIRQTATENLVGDVVRKTQQVILDRDIPGPIEALAMDGGGQAVYAGTGNGCLVTWQINDKGQVARQETIPAFRDGRAVTALALLLGDVTLVVGDANGELTTWLPLRYQGSPDRKLMLAQRLGKHEAAVREIRPSGRTKSILSLAADGGARLDHVTSGRHLLSFGGGDRSLSTVALVARGDMVLGLEGDGRLAAWRVLCPHPEVSWRTLFGKVLYEGYDRPAMGWQTTGGEDYEPKFGLVPLLFGTVKGTLYAMLLAAPLGLFGAVYVSHFTTPGFRRAIKPGVEIMAALPSVVIGFLAALWLAPLVERYVVAVFASLVTVPVALIVFLLAWQPLRQMQWAKRVERGYEFLAVLPVVVLGIAAAVWLAAPVERLLFDGDFRLWLHHALHARYDQRNNIVIAFGLGLAVIPLIFSLADEALSNVPHSLTAASLAMGASRWQTLWRVVLPSASPGIFAAMMIGFGRAVGETMIVLMATGNTPIIDWSPFNGMRALSANIAVEIPEAPVGGTLYRILFLCAVLLFLLTFTLNTVAEVVRQRLRSRYGRY